MLNTPVPYEVVTPHSQRYNYPPSAPRSPAQGLHEPAAPRSRRGSAISHEDEHFVTLADPIINAPPVIVFFSFLNSTSKKWATDFGVVHALRKNVPQGTTVARYHAPVDAPEDFGKELTYAWAVAKSLHVDDKVIGPLFEAVYSKTVVDLEGIRVVFDQCGIPPDMFLKEWGKPLVLKEVRTMQSAIEHVNLQNVPGILVKGKYMVKLDTYGSDFNADRAVELVKDLLGRE